jgi:Uma2 family endonuclease
VEVLSPSKAYYYGISKFIMYRSISSCCEYLLLEQDEIFIEKYSKQSQAWLLSDFNNLEEYIFLELIGVKLPTSEIYRGVDFE